MAEALGAHGEALLVGVDVGAARKDQAARIEHHDGVVERLGSGPFSNHGGVDESGNPLAGCPRPKEDEALETYALAPEPQRGEDAGHDDRRGPLDVVVEVGRRSR